MFEIPTGRPPHPRRPQNRRPASPYILFNPGLGARYRRIKSRRGPQEANVAIQRSMLTANMGTTGEFYQDPGEEFFTRLHPDRANQRAIGQLEAMGYTVTLDQAS